MGESSVVSVRIAQGGRDAAGSGRAAAATQRQCSSRKTGVVFTRPRATARHAQLMFIYTASSAEGARGRPSPPRHHGFA